MARTAALTMTSISAKPAQEDGTHWAPGTMSNGVLALMTPTITNKRFTPLGLALLADVGWQTGQPDAPPETVVQGKLANGLALENRIRPIFIGHEFGNILRLRIRGHKGANAEAFFFREKDALYRHPINITLVTFAQLQRAERTELALNINARFFLKIPAQGVRHEVQRVFMLGTVHNGIYRPSIGLAIRF